MKILPRLWQSQRLRTGCLASGMLFLQVLMAAAQCLPVTITVLPRNAINQPCSTNCVTFSVTATGTALTYQWFFNNLAIRGATTASLRICSITPADEGNYSVRVSNSCSSTSVVARLAVLVDTNPPSLDCPGNLVQYVCSTNPAPLVYTLPTATDDFDRSPSVVCTPAPGALVPPGFVTVRCTATDNCTNRSTCSFRINVVRDTTPPVFTNCPTNLFVAWTCGTNAARVSFPVPMAVDPNLVLPTALLCSHRPGDLFPVGDTTVTCSAIDTCENISRCSFVVRVISDTTPPVIQCPSNIVVAAASPAGTVVSFDVPATDDCDPNVAAVCSPPSGSVFPVGLNRVICRAADQCGNLSRCSFLVEVEDTTPPVLECSTNIVAQAESAEGAVVTWPVTARDESGATLNITCRPPSGSVFPIGISSVTCVAADQNGNQDTCSFTVQVLPPSPLRITLGIGENLDNVILHWRGRQALQHKEILDDSRWQDVPMPVVDQSQEHAVVWPRLTATHFFRLRTIPFLPGPDTDGDGVPDKLDKCPDTPAGATVDACGCSSPQLIRTPQAVFGPVHLAFGGAKLFLDRVATNPSPFSNAVFGAVQRYADSAMMNLGEASESLARGLLCQANTRFMAAVTDWASARTVLDKVVQSVTAEWQMLEHPPTDFGDVSDTDGYVMDLDAMARGLLEAQREAEMALPVVQNACASLREAARIGGVIESIDETRGMIMLSDHRTVWLRKGDYPGNWAEGAFVNITGTQLADGSVVAASVAAAVSANPDILYPHTVFRVAPIQPFPPEGSGPYKLHVPEAYEGPFHEIVLERGMRLAAASIGGVSAGAPSEDTLKIEFEYENDNGGVSTILVTGALKPGATPVGLPDFSDAKFLGKENLIVTVQHKNEGTNTISILDRTTYPVRIATRGGVCTAYYDETEFELPDANQPGNLAITWVYDISTNPLLFGPVDPNTTPVFEFRNFGGSPRQNDDTFFIFSNFDPSGFDPGVYADGSKYLQGVSHPAGITWPRFRGKRHGREFWYSAEVPWIVRDRVSQCDGLPTSYYLLPFQGGWPTWTMGQGNNNPGFTHCPGCYNQFAFDFIAAKNTPILAARGGTILDSNDSNFQNCYSNGKCGNCSANYLKILHQDGSVGVYMHMPQNSITLSKGARVYRGSNIAKVGNVGCSSTAHLHFQVDPYNGAPLSTQITFETLNPCATPFTPPYLAPCDYPNDLHDCYIPNTGDILFSNNHP